MEIEPEPEIQNFPWERKYEHTFEDEDEDQKDGQVQSGVGDLEKKRLEREKRIDVPVKRDIFRNLVIVLDLSFTMSDADFKPSRLEVVVHQLKSFIRKFFIQNSLSMLSLVVSHDRKAFLLTSLSRKSSDHLHALNDLVCSGAFGLQMCLKLASNAMTLSTEQYRKEIICVISSLSTSDPGSIFDTIKMIQDQNISCSVMSLSGEVFLFKKLAVLTGGEFCVPDSAHHLQNFFLRHLQPPVSKPEVITLIEDTNPIKKKGDVHPMGFPVLIEKSNTSYFCTCHVRLIDSYYKCPRCQSVVCELPLICPICYLMLVDYLHFTRSYHHLDPLANFNEVKTTPQLRCYGCFCEFLKGEMCMQCKGCSNVFCETCDGFVHDTIYHCPGCLANK